MRISARKFLFAENNTLAACIVPVKSCLCRSTLAREAILGEKTKACRLNAIHHRAILKNFDFTPVF